MKNKKGFTLIEIIVVLIILGVLAGLSIASYFSWVNRSKIAGAYIAMGQYLKEAQSCFVISGQAACATTPTGNRDFNFFPIDFTGTMGLTDCVAIIAQSRAPAPSAVRITCKCKNVEKFQMSAHSYVGKTIDLSSGTITDCTTDGGTYQGL